MVEHIPEVLGVDIAKASFQVQLLLSDGKERRNKFSNDPTGFQKLTFWLSDHGVEQTHACLEATGSYGGALARFLHQNGHHISVVNPRQIKAFAQSRLSRTKTDATDAALIARFCQTQRPPLWTPPDPALEALQALCRHLEALLQTKQQYQNRLESESNEPVVASLRSLSEFLDTEIDQLKAQINSHLDSHPDLKRQQDLLTSIPGIGELTAARLLAEIPGMNCFDSARQAAAFAGLTPQQRQSGTSVHGRPRLSKIGNGRVRKALYFPAMVAIRFNPSIKAMAERLRGRGKNSMVIIGAAMRKLLHLAYGVLKSGKQFDEKIAAAA